MLLLKEAGGHARTHCLLLTRFVSGSRCSGICLETALHSTVRAIERQASTMKAQAVSSGRRLLAVASSPRTCSSSGTVSLATSITSFRAAAPASSETSSLASHRHSSPAGISETTSNVVFRNKSSSRPDTLPFSPVKTPSSCPGAHAQAGVRHFHNLNRAASTLSWRHPGRPGLTKQLAPASWSRPHRAPHFTATSTRGHATCALAADDHLGSISTTHNTTNTFEMGDRDLLPDSFKAGHYDLKLTNLDFKDWSYNGSVTYAILPSCPSQPAHP